MDEEVKNEENKDNKALTVGLLVLGLIIVLVIVVLVASKLLVKTSAPSPSPAEQSQQAPVATESSLTGPMTSTEMKEVPAEFPKDFPIFKGAQVNAASVTDTGPNVVWMTDTDLSTVVNFYNKEVVSSGWKIVSSEKAESGTLLNLEKGTVKASVGISRVGQSNQTMIFVVVQK